MHSDNIEALYNEEAMETESKIKRAYTDQTDPYKLVAARLPYWHIRTARRLGKGNVSEGIRIALEHMSQETKERGIGSYK